MKTLVEKEKEEGNSASGHLILSPAGSGQAGPFEFCVPRS